MRTTDSAVPEVPAARERTREPGAPLPAAADADEEQPKDRTGAAMALGIAAVVVMSAALLHALLRGDFATEGAALVASPWGLATLTEAYVGFALFSGWIVTRERRIAPAALWIAALLLGGNVVAGAYVAIAAWRSAGDVQRFWTGVPRSP